MGLRRLEARGFRGLREITLDFDAPLVVLYGDNGQGKSSLLQAIEWCLFGSGIEKKSTSGIAARVDWEVAFRGAPRTEVRLRLDLGASAGLAGRDATDSTSRTLDLRRCRQDSNETFECVEEVCHSRAALSRHEDGPRQGELFAMAAPATPQRTSSFEAQEFAGVDAETRLAELGFPNWDEWRQAFCQHQEDPRHGIVDSRDRSAVLASLLGLDAWTRLRARIDGLQIRKFVQRIDKIEDESGRSIESQAAGRGDATAALRRSLIDRGQELNADPWTLAQTIRDRLRELGRRLGQDFAMPAPPSPDASSETFLAWARAFPSAIVRAVAQSKQQSAKLQRRDALTEASRRARDAQADHRRAEAALQVHIAKSGDIQAIQAALAQVRESIEVAKQKLRQEDSRMALLQEARNFLRERTDTSTRCPLCEHEAPELALRIDRALTGDRSDDVRSRSQDLRSELESAARRASDLEGQGREFEGAAAFEAKARRRRDEAQMELAAFLEAAPTEDLLARADHALRDLEREILQSRESLDVLEERVQAFRQDVDLLEDLERLALAESRQALRSDLDGQARQHRLDSALDRAAQFASDLEVLARFAREEQAIASDVRSKEVEANFGRYLNIILSGGRDGEVARSPYRFEQKGTAQNLRYDVVDSEGKSALAIANQATLSAIAFALLFSRAETRVREGEPAFVLLDDPVQSLDEIHVQGLAHALRVLSDRCQVLVAASSRAFVEALGSSDESRLRTITLAPFDVEHGVRLRP